MTDPLGQSQVLPYLIGLNKREYKLTLISFEKKSKPENNKAIIESICQENNIKWQPLNYTKIPPVISTIKDIMVLRRKVKKLFAINKFDIVHCRSYITSLVGLNLIFIQIWGVYGSAIATFIGLMYIAFSGFFLKTYKKLNTEDYKPIQWFLAITIGFIVVYCLKDLHLIGKILLSGALILFFVILFAKVRHHISFLEFFEKPDLTS